MDRGAWRTAVPGVTKELGMTEPLKQRGLQREGKGGPAGLLTCLTLKLILFSLT